MTTTIVTRLLEVTCTLAMLVRHFVDCQVQYRIYNLYDLKWSHCFNFNPIFIDISPHSHFLYQQAPPIPSSTVIPRARRRSAMATRRPSPARTLWAVTPRLTATATRTLPRFPCPPWESSPLRCKTYYFLLVCGFVLQLINTRFLKFG